MTNTPPTEERLPTQQQPPPSLEQKVPTEQQPLTEQTLPREEQSPTEQQPPASEPLLADTDSDRSDDAELESVASSTASMTSSILRYREENGRTYHAFKEGRYILPNDDPENSRLDLQHHLYFMTHDGKLYTCPAGEDGKQIQHVLDAGTGTGVWALDFADEHPEATVVGVDLSPIQPGFVPSNLHFFIDDLEEPWTFSGDFDFIYARMLTGSIRDWPRFFKQSFEFLSPGGWLELSDIVFPIESDDGSVPEDSAIKRWGDHSLEASIILGSPLDSATRYAEQMTEAGFKNVVATKYKWPINAWPKNRKYKEMGVCCKADMCDGISGLSLALFTRGLKWTAEELEVFLVQVRKDWVNKQIHGYWPIYVVYGQKPDDN